MKRQIRMPSSSASPSNKSTTIIAIYSAIWATVFGLSATLCADADFLASDIQLSAREWLVRVDKSGHEPTVRIDVRSNGDIRVLKGRKGTAEWQEIYAGTVPQADRAQVYDAARTLLRRFELTDRLPVISSRDDSTAYEVMLTTASGAMQVSIKLGEQIRDKLFTRDLAQLVATLQRSLPSTVGLNEPKYWPNLDR